MIYMRMCRQSLGLRMGIMTVLVLVVSGKLSSPMGGE